MGAFPGRLGCVSKVPLMRGKVKERGIGGDAAEEKRGKT
jgi:hypothetical protein